MKKYFLYACLFLGTVFSSCEDFLDVESLSSFDSDYVFSTETDAFNMLLGAYSCFPTDYFTSRMSNVFMQNTDVEATSVSAARDNSRRDVWSLEPQQSFSDMTNCWNMCFLAIDRSNQCIEGIQNSPLYKADNKNMKQLLGEAYCMRAFWYYFLINFYGDVPPALQASKAGMALDMARADKNIIYTELIQNLLDSESEMLWADELIGGIERMNREFALGMIARLSLFRGGYSMQADGTMKRPDDYKEYYQIAKDACQKLISLKDRQLNPSFKQVFMNQCLNLTPANDDVLFEVAFVQGGGGDVGWCIGLSVSAGDYGSGGSYVNFPATYYYSFDEKDTRFDVTCAQIKYSDVKGTTRYEDVNDFQGTTPGKWCRAWTSSALGTTTSKGTGINWPLMRYSDVLLMLAEAENELNGATATAKDALKRVRSRAFNPSDHTEKVDGYINNLGSKEDLFKAIVNERAWEFGGECLRRFDLVRWNLYGEKITEVKQGLTAMGLASRGITPNSPVISKFTDANNANTVASYYTQDIYNKYAMYADKLYYRKLTANGTVDNINGTTIEWYNKRWKPGVIPPIYDNPNKGDNHDGYIALDWASNGVAITEVTTEGVKDTTVLTQSDWVKRSYRGYTNAAGAQVQTIEEARTVPVSYLLPIGITIINASDSLTNEGYGLKNL